MSFCFKDPLGLLDRLLPRAVLIQEHCFQLHYRSDSIISKLDFKALPLHAVYVYSQISLMAVNGTSLGLWQAHRFCLAMAIENYYRALSRIITCILIYYHKWLLISVGREEGKKLELWWSWC